MKNTFILGISCFYHDSAAVLVKNGRLIAAAQEERFSRIKHDPSFPRKAIKYCLKKGGISPCDINHIAFYEKPLLKFERILQTFLETAPKSSPPFLHVIPSWLKQKIWVKTIIRQELNYRGEILFLPHHLSHAASTFLVSPYKKAAILTLDGVGEWETTTRGWGEANKIFLDKAIHFPHSLGLLYAAFTYYCGFRILSGEYKLMGLAAYGQPKYTQDIYNNLIEVKNDGSFRLNMKYFGYENELKMINSNFEQLFGQTALSQGESSPPQFYRDIAASIQKVTEETILKIVKDLYRQTKTKNLCLAGGVALNCVANSRILKETPVKNLFIQPAAGDAGGALGAAFWTYNSFLDKKRVFKMKNVYFGPEFTQKEIDNFLKKKNIIQEKPRTRKEMLKRVVELLADQKIVGWFQGAAEWGPRALGNRSILADPRNPQMKDIINKKVKHRETFRPFACSILEDKMENHFDLEIPTPFMILTGQIKSVSPEIPAVVHIDGLSRIQSVNRQQNPLYYDLIKLFYKKTGCPAILNTSFNVRGEPIVSTPKEAYNCFMGTDMDFVVLGDNILDKKKMMISSQDKAFRFQFKPD